MNLPALICAIVAAVLFAWSTVPRPTRFNLVAGGLCLLTVAWILAVSLPELTPVRF